MIISFTNVHLSTFTDSITIGVNDQAQIVAKQYQG